MDAIKFRRFPLAALSLLIGLSVHCGGSSTSPAAPTQTVAVTSSIASVTVGTAGNAPATLAPGATLQLWAQASMTDGSKQDVTNLALWQSSNPAVATVSAQGLLSATQEGSAEVTANFSKVIGTLHADVKAPGCSATQATPGTFGYGAFGGSGAVTVTAGRSDCRWTVASDAPWLPFTYDPGRSGNGTFYYSVPPNNYPAGRIAHLIVSVEGGTQLIHTVSQEPPASCSYVVKPGNASFPASGGTGFFDVTTTPSDCRWTATNGYSSRVTITGGSSGTGSGRVTYAVAPNPYTFSLTPSILIAGLSGANPPATFSIAIAGR